MSLPLSTTIIAWAKCLVLQPFLPVLTMSIKIPNFRLNPVLPSTTTHQIIPINFQKQVRVPAPLILAADDIKVAAITAL